MTDSLFIMIMGGLVALTGLIAVATLRHRGVWVVLALLVGSYCFATLGSAALRGKPKAVASETQKVQEAEVLWAGVSAQKKIYLLLNWPGLPEPRYYWMDWSGKRERQLNQGRANAAAKNGKLMMKAPFGGASDTEGEPVNGRDGGPGEGDGTGQATGDNDGANAPTFYSPPPPPLPEKEIDQ